MYDPTLSIAIIIMLLLSLMWTVSSVSGSDPAEPRSRQVEPLSERLPDETSPNP